MAQIIIEIRHSLKRLVQSNGHPGYERWFKEPIKTYGVRSAQIDDLAKKYFQEVKGLPKKQIFALAEELLASGYNEEAHIAFDWVFRLRKQFTQADFKTFESWIKQYVSNWATCDDFCTHALGYYLLTFPKFLPRLEVWAKSRNRWLRRASAVSLIVPLRKGKCLSEALRLADLLITDDDDLVRKGYGWMLKVATEKFQLEVFDYVIKNKNRLPRVALRYAIEKLPTKLKNKAMKK